MNNRDVYFIIHNNHSFLFSFCAFRIIENVKNENECCCCLLCRATIPMEVKKIEQLNETWCCRIVFNDKSNKTPRSQNKMGLHKMQRLFLQCLTNWMKEKNETNTRWRRKNEARSVAASVFYSGLCVSFFFSFVHASVCPSVNQSASHSYVYIFETAIEIAFLFVFVYLLPYGDTFIS